MSTPSAPVATLLRPCGRRSPPTTSRTRLRGTRPTRWWRRSAPSTGRGWFSWARTRTRAGGALSGRSPSVRDFGPPTAAQRSHCATPRWSSPPFLASGTRPWSSSVRPDSSPSARPTPEPCWPLLACTMTTPASSAQPRPHRSVPRLIPWSPRGGWGRCWFPTWPTNASLRPRTLSPP